MKVTTAILQVADTSPLESIVEMLEAVGIKCLIPDTPLKDALRSMGCDTVLDIDYLVRSWGYDRPKPLGIATLADMGRSDVLYVDVKGHRNGPIVWKRWPNLRKRTLWYRINGGKPEHVITKAGIDHGDEVNPPCPVLTPNQWYSSVYDDGTTIDLKTYKKDWAYTMWPPFVRIEDYDVSRLAERISSDRATYGSPICLIHGIEGWGYKALIPTMQDLGVRMFGVNAPDGLINHREVAVRLTDALCMVHLKSNDAPGYALYEALAAGCPVICTRRLIWRCRMQELLIPGETCLVFDRETHDALSQEDVRECKQEVEAHIKTLHNRKENHRIGDAGKKRLREVMWSRYKETDVSSLRNFLEVNFS